MIGWIILAIVLIAFVAAAIFLLTKSDFPPYKWRKKGIHRETTCYVFAQNEALLNRYNSHLLAKAARSVVEAWEQKSLPNLDKVKDVMKNVAVLITTKEGFQRWAFYQHSVAASVQSWTKDKIYSKSMPMMVVHEGTLDRLDGIKCFEMQPMIHEMLHAVLSKVKNSPDHQHVDDDIWIKNDDIVQIEELAQQLYMRY